LIDQSILTNMQVWRRAVEEELAVKFQTQEPMLRTLYEAMRYSLFAGGKRLRPLLALAAAQTMGGSLACALPAACALECIHTYSLIHDDLPAMDDDDLRRGKPTNHKVYGEAAAVLAGDGLLTYAFELLAEAFAEQGGQTGVRLISELSRAAGPGGMVGGQMADVEAEGAPVQAEQLEFIHQRKTGALIVAAVRMGAICAGAKLEELEALTGYARNLGLAFQIMDDILDIVGESDKLGKQVGADAALEKLTYPRVYGMEESKRLVHVYSEAARCALRPLNRDTRLLTDLLEYMANRDH